MLSLRGQGLWERSSTITITKQWKIYSTDITFSGGNSGKQKWGKIRQEEQVPYASLKKKKQCSENLRNKSKNAAHRHWHRKKEHEWWLYVPVEFSEPDLQCWSSFSRRRYRPEHCKKKYVM